MNTKLLSVDRPEDLALAAELIRQGGLVGLPTETVYGLGANGLDPAAVAKIFAAKGRPQDNPLILHIHTPAQLSDFCLDIPDAAWLLAERFWPGPLSIVLKAKTDVVPAIVRAGGETVSLRRGHRQIESIPEEQKDHRPDEQSSCIVYLFSEWSL